MSRHAHMLDRSQTAIVVVDVQEAYRRALFNWNRLTARVRLLVAAARELGLPMLVTEQYPRGLGHTAAEVSQMFPPGLHVFEKQSFSSCGAPGFLTQLRATARSQVLVAGIEAHVCVNQTVHDLLGEGFQVHLVEDAVSARSEEDYRTGCAKMRAGGAIPASVELVLFEILRTAEAREFKAIQALVR